MPPSSLHVHESIKMWHEYFIRDTERLLEDVPLATFELSVCLPLRSLEMVMSVTPAPTLTGPQ